MEHAAIHVLLVDDDDSYAMLVKRVFRKLQSSPPIALSRVSDGDDALDYLLGRGLYSDRQSHPIPQVILLDERMPRVDGSEVLAQLRANDTMASLGWPVICHMSSGQSQRLLAHSYSLGATFCINKPMQYEKLTAKLTMMIDFFQTVLELPHQEGF